MGGIRYGEARTFGGKFRSAMLTITLRKYVPFKSLESSEKTPPNTYYRPTQVDDTHEIIALQNYKAAIKGVNLRNRYPSLDIVIPTGSIVTVLEPNHPDIISPTAPVSDVFLGIQENPEILQDALTARSGTYTSTIQRF